MDAVLHALAELRDAVPDAAPLVDELESVARAGGKQIRPRLLLLGYLAGGGEPGTRLERAEAAVELLHVFAMLQDDVMDDATRRRGRPASYLALRLPGRDPERFGRSAALLAADLAFIWSDRLLRTSGFSGTRLERALLRWDAMRLAAVAGQYLDVRMAHTQDADESQAMRAAALKTAGYTVVGPLCLGAELAGAGSHVLETLEAYGRPLGVAFQLTDDLLELAGDPQATGKDGLDDVREATGLVVLRALALADEHGRTTIRSGSREGAAAVVASTGAAEQLRRDADALADEAAAALRSPPLQPEIATLLADLAREVVTRDR